MRRGLHRFAFVITAGLVVLLTALPAGTAWASSPDNHCSYAFGMSSQKLTCYGVQKDITAYGQDIQLTFAGHTVWLEGHTNNLVEIYDGPKTQANDVVNRPGFRRDLQAWIRSSISEA